MKAYYSKKDFEDQSEDFRIGAIISDGMWLSQPKWRKLSKVSEKTLEDWIASALSTGSVVQSDTGARSYRMPHDEIYKWYQDHGFTPGEQILEHIFPARIWGGQTETEGFMSAPLREIGMVTFHCHREDVVDEIRDALMGIGKVRQSDTGVYRVYSLNALVARRRIEPILKRAYEGEARIYSRNSSYRRELKDFSEEFGTNLVDFYRKFARSLVKGAQETINIFMEDKEDQESQITLWVISAIEKFDESAAVPFSGYLNTVINRWVYDLPDDALGKDLSNFQREKSRAMKILRSKTSGGDHNREFTNDEISEIMGIDKKKFFDLESKNKLWNRVKTSTSLTWDETAEEKQSTSAVDALSPKREDTDIDLASQMSFAAVVAALHTGEYDSAFSLATQIGADEMDTTRLDGLSVEFVKEFGSHMGLR